MILTCPNCGTQYVVKDGAIPPEGRQVRCAACKHSWHQDPDLASETETAREASVTTDASTGVAAVAHEGASAADERAEEGLAEASLIEPRTGPEAEERAYEESLIGRGSEPVDPEPAGADEPAPQAEATGEASSADEQSETISEHSGAIPDPAGADRNEPPVAEARADTFSPFAEAAPADTRRRSPLLTVLIIIVIIVAAAALFWFLAPPALKAKLGITSAEATPLQLVTTHMDRTPLESGNELLTVTGRVINPSAKEQDVPPIQAQLKNHSGKVVYSWTIEPPAHSLAAGASASFNSAEVNVPPGADELTITLGEPQA